MSLFFEQLGLAVQAGIPEATAAWTAAEAFGNDRSSSPLHALTDLVDQGSCLADAMENTSGFPATAAAMVRIGEQTGKLDDVLLGLARYYEWEDTTRTAVRNAVLYPAVLSLMMTVILAILLSQVLPAFRQMFGSLGMSAAASSSAMAVGLTIGETALVVAAVIAVALISMLCLLSSSHRDAVLGHIGGAAYSQLNRGRFASAMQLSLTAGCSTEAAAALAAKTIENLNFQNHAMRAADAIGIGVSVPDALEGEGMFSPLDTRLLRFGASAGALDAVLGRIASRCRQNAEDRLDRILSVIEPVLVAVLSVVVGGILLSVMLPLLRLLTSMG
jgi:Type II secretory pathway, component PulF